MTNYHVPTLELTTDQSPLELSRKKAISTILHSITKELPPGYPTYFVDVSLANHNKNNVYQAWQTYATEYAAEGREVMSATLEQNTRWVHPSEKYPTREIGSLTLALFTAEMDIRKEAYTTMLPGIIMDGITISDDHQQRIQASVAQGLSTIDKAFRFQPWVISQIGANIFFTHTLRQLQSEQDALSLAVQEVCAKQNHLVGGTALRSL